MNEFGRDITFKFIAEHSLNGFSIDKYDKDKGILCLSIDNYDFDRLYSGAYNDRTNNFSGLAINMKRHFESILSVKSVKVFQDLLSQKIKIVFLEDEKTKLTMKPIEDIS